MTLKITDKDGETKFILKDDASRPEIVEQTEEEENQEEDDGDGSSGTVQVPEQEA